MIKSPHADPDKFDFDVSLTNKGDLESTAIYYKLQDGSKCEYDITSDTFKNEYADVLEWGPKIWGVNESLQHFPLNAASSRRVTNELPFDITKFDIFVNENHRLNPPFEPIKTTWKNETNSKDIRKCFNKSDPYFASLLAAYVVSYRCGINLKHLKHYKNTPNIITSIARFNIYFHMKRFIRDPSLLNSRLTLKDVEFIKKNIPTKNIWVDKEEYGNREKLILFYEKHPYTRNAHYFGGNFGGALGIKYEQVDKIENQSDNDWMKIIQSQQDSNGITRKGKLLLQQAIEAYVYSVLGAQAKIRCQIVRCRCKIFTNSTHL